VHIADVVSPHPGHNKVTDVNESTDGIDADLLAEFYTQLGVTMQHLSLFIETARAFAREVGRLRKMGVRLSGLPDPRFRVERLRTAGGEIIPYLFPLNAYLRDLAREARTPEHREDRRVLQQMRVVYELATRAYRSGEWARTEYLKITDAERAKVQRLTKPAKFNLFKLWQAVERNSPYMGVMRYDPPDTRHYEEESHFSPAAEAEKAIPMAYDDEARILSGDLPTALRPRLYTKRNTPADPEMLRKANQVLNKYAAKKKEGHEFTDAQMEIVRAARRVKIGDQRLRRRLREQSKLTQS